MKQLLVIIFIAASATLAQAQDKKIAQDTLGVAGVCGMCKSRIEGAAMISGVKKVEWDKNAQQLVVIYNTKKTSLDKISLAIQDVGHDTSLGPATAGKYEQIDGCCRYREMEVH